MDRDFFDSHKDFYVYTADRKLTYRVVSVFEYDDRHILNSFDFKNDAIFGDWLSMIKNPHTLYGNVNEDVKLDLNSKLLVLSTCTDSGEGRLLLQGVMIKDEQTK
jgi:sortase B